MPPDYPVNEWWGFVAKGLEHFGKDIHAVLKLKEQLVEAGFVNVEEKIIKTPIGTWPKDKNLKTVGLYWRSSINDGLEGLSLGPFVRGQFLLFLHSCFGIWEREVKRVTNG